LLEGKNINLKLLEKDDVPRFMDWINDTGFWGQYNGLRQVSKAEVEKELEGPTRPKQFLIEKKDGTRVGFIGYSQLFPGASQLLWFGYSLAPDERGKGYGTEAVNLMLDFCFLSGDALRMQAFVDLRNAASQRVLEKTGFQKEGVVRKIGFLWGEWRDMLLYSILRDDWKAPRVLKVPT